MLGKYHKVSKRGLGRCDVMVRSPATIREMSPRSRTGDSGGNPALSQKGSKKGFFSSHKHCTRQIHEARKIFRLRKIFALYTYHTVTGNRSQEYKHANNQQR